MQLKTSEGGERRSPGSNAAALALSMALATAPLMFADPAYARSAPDGFADLIESVSPAVVQITTRQSAAGKSAHGNGDLSQIPEQFREGPMRDFFERFFREGVPGDLPEQQAERTALGSGFIISSDGTVVTNNHVIGDAEQDRGHAEGWQPLSGALIGSDEKTDLAVIKIDADRTLPTVAGAIPDHARVGDWVVAVGNPFGLAGTATAGIVSSRGRDIGAGPYDDFIQIDAPINTRQFRRPAVQW